MKKLSDTHSWGGDHRMRFHAGDMIARGFRQPLHRRSDIYHKRRLRGDVGR